MAQKDFLKGLSKEQIAQLGLSPEVTSQLEGLQDVSMGALPEQPNTNYAAPFTQDPLQQQRQAESAGQYSSVADGNLMMAQEEPIAFQAMNSALTSSGFAPSPMPAPLQPVSGNLPEDQAALQAMQMQADQQAQVQAVTQSAMQKAVTQQAAQAAQEETKKAEEAVARDAQNEAQINQDIKEQAPNLSSQIGQAIAIMMGAYSQGLTGSKENPGLAAIEKRAEQIAAAKKYNDEQKLKLADMLYKQGQQQIDRQKNTIDSMIGLKKLEQADQEIAIKRQELDAKLKGLQGVGKQTYTNAERLALQASGSDGRALVETMVRLPNGNWAPTQSDKAGEKVREESIILDKALYSAKKLRQSIDFFGNDVGKKLLAFNEKASIEPEIQALVGGLRLEYFGPGILTEEEQATAKKMMGRPDNFLSIASSNAARIGSIINKLNYAKRAQLRSAGIDLPKSQNEVNLEKLRANAPNTPDSALINTLMRAGKWNPDEE